MIYLDIVNDFGATQIIEGLILGIISILVYVFKRELFKIEEMIKNLQKDQTILSNKVNINEKNIELNSSKDDDFKTLLNEKFISIANNIEKLSTQINVLINKIK